ncbi:MAG: nucleotidyltransferase family protein [Gammaproteobacteria bacterium]|nr:nucleotidyltransferase family protein [Gammaproteobacteria bacterium]
MPELWSALLDPDLPFLRYALIDYRAVPTLPPHIHRIKMNYTHTVAFLCQCLAFWDSGLIGAAEETINSDQADWHKMLRCAGQHNVAPALYTSLKKSGLLHRLPYDAAEYLHAVWSLTRQRNRMLRQALVSVCSQLNTIDITPLLLKGAAGLVPEGKYPGADDRIMADLDLLMPEGRTEEASNILKRKGYRRSIPDDKVAFWECIGGQHHHDIPIRHPDFPVKIELHRHAHGVKELDNTEPSAWKGAVKHEYSGAEVFIPGPAFAILHNFIHHQLQEKAFPMNKFDLRRLYEFTLFCRTWDQEIRYEELNRFCAEKRISAAWQAYWLSAHRLFGLPLKTPITSSYARYKDTQVRLRTHFPRIFWWDHWFSRVCRLPKRLVTPSWYPLKYRQLTSTGEFAKDSDER